MKKTNLLKLKGPQKIAIVYRLRTPEAVALATKTAAWLKELGHSVYTAPEQNKLSGTVLLKKSKELNQIALTIVFGGDGTYLRAVRLFHGTSTPILGFNMGNLGFLTVHNSADYQKEIESALNGKMCLFPRSMLQTVIHRKGKIRATYCALNDLVIERGSNSQLLNCTIYSEDHLVSQVRADGFIVSTPTGSTAYNLSAGGPLMHPQVKALIVTPVAPHSLTSRPLIFPDDRDLKIKLDNKSLMAHVVIDGVKTDELSYEDEVHISKSKFSHFVVRNSDHSFFHLLRDKLRFGDR